MNTSLHPLRSLEAALLLVALSGAPALAQAQGQGGSGRTPLTPAQKQKLFPAMRSLSLQGNQARIGILQTSQQCLSAATSMDALKACQQQERQASMAQRQQFRQGMQQLFESNGIAMPQPQPQSRNNI